VEPAKISLLARPLRRHLGRGSRAIKRNALQKRVVARCPGTRRSSDNTSMVRQPVSVVHAGAFAAKNGSGPLRINHHAEVPGRTTSPLAPGEGHAVIGRGRSTSVLSRRRRRVELVEHDGRTPVVQRSARWALKRGGRPRATTGASGQVCWGAWEKCTVAQRARAPRNSRWVSKEADRQEQRAASRCRRSHLHPPAARRASTWAGRQPFITSS